jgi:hypothetical protein
VAPDDDDAPISLAATAIERLNVGEEAKQALRAILTELAAQYQQSFILMLETQRKQASALDRLQTTLQLLIEKIAPEIKDRIPVPIRLASEGERADLTSAVILADPMAAGFTMSQAQLAKALGLSQADVSVLVRAFKLNEEEDCAVVVRRGRTNTEISNYHARAIDRFREIVAAPPAKLDSNQRSALERVRKGLRSSGGNQPR